MPIAAGVERTEEFTVEGPLTTDVGGTIEATVGFEVCIKHVGAAMGGSTCVSHARLREVADGRKLRFDVEVSCDGRTIGVGTHERRVVDAAGFGG